jgi:hypothetical protein
VKLGQQVKFKVDYVKAHEYVSEETATDEQLEDVFPLKKLIPREHNAFKQGIICGKRNYVVENQMQYEDRPFGDWHFQTIGQTYETFYLVACNLRGFCKVRECDLEVIS